MIHSLNRLLRHAKQSQSQQTGCHAQSGLTRQLTTLALAASSFISLAPLAHAGNLSLIHEYQAENNFLDSIRTSPADGTNEYGWSSDGVTFAPGESGSAFNFEGNSYASYISLGLAGSLSAGTKDFAVSAWVRTSDGWPQTIINQRYLNPGDSEYMLNIGGNHNSSGVDYGHVYFLLTGPGSDYLQELWSNAYVADDQWHQIRVERTGATISLFIDGELDNTATYDAPAQINATWPTFIGVDYRNWVSGYDSKFFDGQIDDVRIEQQPDIAPPDVTKAQPSISTLWPANHSMVKISISGIVDVTNAATVTVTGVTQDETTNGLGDGDTAVDAIISKDGSVQLRAERSGKGNGRVYHVHFTATNAGGSTSGVVAVSVPHDKGSNAVDGGELFDSTK